MKKLLLLVLLLSFSWGEVVEVKVVAEGPTPTELSVVNKSKDSVLVYLTLSGYPKSDSANYLQNVNGVFGITQSGLVGSFYLGASDSVSYTLVKWLSGNISFGAQPINCFTEQWPTGINAFEFNLNNPQESIDISAIGGVNCIMTVNCYSGPNWQANPSFPDVRYFFNDTLYKNTNLVGVFPYGCTNCVNDQGKQPCVLKPELADSARICNPTRSAGSTGGKVVVHFLGYTNFEICK